MESATHAEPRNDCMTDEDIQNKRKQLEATRAKLWQEMMKLKKLEENIQQEFKILWQHCKHPSKCITIEFEGGAYGGKTKHCNLCGWSHYTD